NEAIWYLLFSSQVSQQRQELIVNVAILQAADHCLGSFQSLLESVTVEGLQQIVERVHLEGFQSILIVGSDEDHGGHSFSADSFDYFKTIHRRHLDVEENEVGTQLANGTNCFVSIRAFANHFNTGIVRQQTLDSSAGEWFIVDDQGSNFRWSNVTHTLLNCLIRS